MRTIQKNILREHRQRGNAAFVFNTASKLRKQVEQARPGAARTSVGTDCSLRRGSSLGKVQ